MINVNHKHKIKFFLGAVIAILCSCNRPSTDKQKVEIPQFNFSQNLSFETQLSSYQIYSGNPSELKPSSEFHLLELSSPLFTDYAHKQRLVKIPAGTQITKRTNGEMEFPDGAILIKSFFYYHNESDTSLGKQVVETRVEIKENGVWNIASYVWNETQTEAYLAFDGKDVPISWTNEAGRHFAITYHVPSQNECMTCHQVNASVQPIGPTLRHLNREVLRAGSELNQLSYLQSQGILAPFDVSTVGTMVNYADATQPLHQRGRAYLAMNCAHCHNPNAWSSAAERDFDFRYHLSDAQTGVIYETEKIKRNVLEREMPFIGTTLLDEEGIALLVEYLDSI